MEYVAYKETIPGIAKPLQEIVIGQAIENLQLKLKTLKAEKKPSKYLASITGLVSGFDDDCLSAVIGFVFDCSDEKEFNGSSTWAFKHLFDYLLPGTWDQTYEGRTTLSGFMSDFRLNSNINLK